MVMGFFQNYIDLCERLQENMMGRKISQRFLGGGHGGSGSSYTTIVPTQLAERLIADMRQLQQVLVENIKGESISPTQRRGIYSLHEAIRSGTKLSRDRR